jgi:hypothetical protein
MCDDDSNFIENILIEFLFGLGDLAGEKEVFDWILTQKNDESIEDVDRATFLKYIETKDFLAVVFCK